MGAAVGLLFALGVLLLWRSGPFAGSSWPRRGDRGRVRDLIAEAGIEGVTPRQVYCVSAGGGLVVFLAVMAVSQSPPVALAFACFTTSLPFSLLGWRRRRRADELREVWPDVVDNLASAVRAGLSLPEAVSQLGVRGPEVLRPQFSAFSDDYRATGRFDDSLDRLKDRLADPVGDRLVESLRLAREVGGHDLGRLLRTLSAFLRDDVRTRGELEARQSWTVSGARLAVAAPWLLLGMLSLRPQTVAAYNSPAGAIVLAVGAAVSIVAYRLMRRIARLPAEARVLR